MKNVIIFKVVASSLKIGNILFEPHDEMFCCKYNK